MQIFINGLPAIPKSGTTIKLTEENFFYTKSSSYTYEIELPMAIKQNRAIYGLLNRIDTGKRITTLPARIIAAGKVLLDGEAHVTSISESSLKVQLLGNNSAYNFKMNTDEVYIDELPLGNWYEITFGEANNGFYGNGVMSILNRMGGGAGRGSADFYTAITTRLRAKTLPWVAHMVYNSSAQMDCNKYVVQFTTAACDTLQLRLRAYEGDPYYRAGNERPSDVDPYTPTFCPQPYIWLLAELVASGTGMTLDKADNALYTDPFLKNIFMVSCATFYDVAACLPHWTVNEFWENIENAFGLVMSIDYAEKRIRLHTRSQHYGADIEDGTTKAIKLTKVEDSYTIDVQEETHRDPSVSNIGFADYESDPAKSLSDLIRKTAKVDNTGWLPQGLLGWMQDNELSTIRKKGVLHDTADGRRFAYFRDCPLYRVNGEEVGKLEGLVQVDQFRPVINDPNRAEDIDIELKFVPARQIEAELNVHPPYVFSTGHSTASTPNNPYTADQCQQARVMILQTPGPSELPVYGEGEDDLDIQGLIESEDNSSSDKESKIPDVIYMAIDTDGYMSAQTAGPNNAGATSVMWPRALTASTMRMLWNDDLAGFRREQSAILLDGDKSLSLVQVEGEQSLYSHSSATLIGIDTTSRHCISFISEEMPPADALFYIKGKAFICEKIEATIDDNGLSPRYTGYFYPIDLTNS